MAETPQSTGRSANPHQGLAHSAGCCAAQPPSWATKAHEVMGDGHRLGRLGSMFVGSLHVGGGSEAESSIERELTRQAQPTFTLQP